MLGHFYLLKSCYKFLICAYESSEATGPFHTPLPSQRILGSVNHRDCLLPLHSLSPRSFFPSSVLKSLSSLWNAALNALWSCQFEKSGIKYSRISTAKSLPLSASKHFQHLIVSAVYNPNREQLPPALLKLLLPRVMYLRLDPFALYTSLGQNDEQLVVVPNCLLAVIPPWAIGLQAKPVCRRGGWLLLWEPLFAIAILISVIILRNHG